MAINFQGARLVEEFHGTLAADCKSHTIVLALGVIAGVGSLFLFLAYYKIVPARVNCISELNTVGVGAAVVTGALSTVLLVGSSLSLSTTNSKYSVATEAQYLRAASNISKSAELYYQSAVALFNQGSLEDIQALEKQISQFIAHHSPIETQKIRDCYLLLAEKAYALKDFPLVIQCFAQADKLSFLSPCHLIGYLLAYLKQQNSESACSLFWERIHLKLKEFVPLCQLLPSDENSLILIFCAEQLKTRGYFESALECCDSIENKAPKAWILEAYCCLELREPNFEAAERCIGHLNENSVDEVNELKDLASIFKALRNYYSEKEKKRSLLGKSISYMIASESQESILAKAYAGKAFAVEHKIITHLIAHIATLLSEDKIDDAEKIVGQDASAMLPHIMTYLSNNHLSQALHQRMLVFSAICCIKVGSPEAFKLAETQIENIEATGLSLPFQAQLGSIFIRLGQFYTQLGQQNYWKGQNTQKAHDYYVKACFLLESQSLQAALPQLKELTANDRIQKSELLKAGVEAFERNEWKKAAYYFVLAMQPLKKVPFFSHQPCREAMVHFLKTVAEGIQNDPQEDWLMLIDLALAARGNITDLIDKNTLTTKDKRLTIIDTNGNFTVDMGAKLHDFKAQLLEKKNGAKEEILKEYIMARNLDLNNPFGCSALFLIDEKDSDFNGNRRLTIEEKIEIYKNMAFIKIQRKI